VIDRVVTPLEATPNAVWFTDVIDHFFVKSGGKRREQAEAIAADYAPFAAAVGLPTATLPPRPSIDALVRLGSSEHRSRLRGELIEAAAPVVVTLGEEARRVLVAIADFADGPPTQPLDGRRFDNPNVHTYGEAGEVAIAGHVARWYALVHPGQRSRAWQERHQGWIGRRRRQRPARGDPESPSRRSPKVDLVR
jgi:hypothetical protein